MSKAADNFLLCVVLFGLIGCSCASYFIGRQNGRLAAEAGSHEQIIRDTVIRVDTVVFEKPVPVAYRITDTMLVPVPVTEHDTIMVSLPRSEREYRDSSYHAVVSGYDPSLDRIEVFPKTVTISEIETRWKEAPRWSLGAAAGPTVCYGSGGLNAGLGVTFGVVYRFK